MTFHELIDTYYAELFWLGAACFFAGTLLWQSGYGKYIVYLALAAMIGIPLIHDMARQYYALPWYEFIGYLITFAAGIYGLWHVFRNF